MSPYDTPFSRLGLEDFRAMLLRQADPAALGVRPDDAMLLIGAVDVLSGEFRTFNSRRETITADAVLASAAIPTIFRAVHLDGGSSRSPTGATSSRATCRCTRSCTSSSCRARACRRGSALRPSSTRDGVTWTVRVDGERSRAHAELRDGRITRFVVGQV